MMRRTKATVVAPRHPSAPMSAFGLLALGALAGLASGSIDLVVTGTSGTGTIANIGPMGAKPPAAKAEPFTVDPAGRLVFKDALKTKDFRPCFVEPFPRATDRQTGVYAVVVSGPGPFSLIDALYFDFSAKTAVSHYAPPECCLPWVNASDVAVSTSVDFEVSGLNPGQQVELRYRWVVGGQAESRDEGPGEDSAQISNADFEILVNGLAPPGPGQLPAGGLAVADPNTGTDEHSEGDGWTKFCVDDDDVITVNVNIATDSFNTDPGRAQATCPGIGRIDRDERTYTAGRLEIEIYDFGCPGGPGGGGGPPPPIPPAIPPIEFPPGYEPPPDGPSQELLFSIDIGSDTEVSNTLLFPTAPPVFDPGDLYRQFGPPMPLPTNGVFDDEALLGGTAAPTPFGPYAPYCVFPSPPQPLPIDFLDVDGTDTLDVDLSQFLDPRLPLDEHLPRLSLATQFDPTYLLVSFDDDGAEPYWSFCSVPFSSPSPVVSDTFGSTAERDEVVELFSDPLSRSVPDVPAMYEALPERGVHISLAGNPDEFNTQPDDDVDALDATWTDYTARYWYYSVDHEAAGDPLAAGLPFAHVPHSVYMADRAAPGDQRLVVDGGIHLGLRDGTDVDAFEFVVIGPLDADSQPGLRTALLFSVDDDDPTTAADESGGLDPAAIYASFLDGRHTLYAETELGEDIDAIAAGFRSLAVDQYLPDPGPTPCNEADLVAPFGTLDIDDVLAFLDAFAQGDAAVADLTGDGTLDIDDVLQFLDAFARGCP